MELAGAPASATEGASLAFIGIAFRIQPMVRAFECICLRPTNARAKDQLRRNRSVQYISFPDYPWQRSRNESPGRYESYTDLEPEKWTKVKLVISGVNAQSYVQDARQPCLVVSDLKLGVTTGAVGLWAGPGTNAHFSALRLGPGAI
jgi:hypothetical protein